MFDFAISHNQRRRPTRRLFASIATSCLIHLFLLVVLIENPWLLEGGLYPDFRGWLISPDDSAGYKSDTEDENLRTITVLRPMASPSMEVLKQLTYNWDNPPKEEVPPHRFDGGMTRKPHRMKILGYPLPLTLNRNPLRPETKNPHAWKETWRITLPVPEEPLQPHLQNLQALHRHRPLKKMRLRLWLSRPKQRTSP